MEHKTPKMKTASKKMVAGKKMMVKEPKAAMKMKKVVGFDLDEALGMLPEIAGETQPEMPVAVAIHEADDLAAAVKKYHAKLMKLPFDHLLVETLPHRIAALREAEDAWRKAKAKRTPKDLAKMRMEATELKRDMLAACRYFLREDDEAMAELDEIVAGDGLPDLVEDLHALSGFLKVHAEPLAEADLPGGVEPTAMHAEELANSLTEAASNERVDTTSAEVLTHRNRCYALLMHAVHEVRAAGRYAMRKDPEALVHFRNGYAQKKMARARVEKPEAGETDPKTMAAG